MFTTVLQSVIMLCLIILTGVAARRIGIINDEVNTGLSGLLLRVTLPCTIIMAMQRPFETELLVNGLVVLANALAVNFISALAGILLCKLCRVSKNEVGVWLFVATFANVGYMGYPVIGAIYGDQALFYVAMNNISFNLLTPTLGVLLLQGGGLGSARIRISEPIVAIIIGVVLFVFSIRLPVPVSGAMSLIGGMTTPIAMLIVGAFLAQNSIKAVFSDAKIYALAALRLLVIPVAVFFAIRPFISDSMMLGVMTYLPAMPAAAVTVVFAKRYGGDAATASRAVFITMVMSVVTLPLISLLF